GRCGTSEWRLGPRATRPPRGLLEHRGIGREDEGEDRRNEGRTTCRRALARRRLRPPGKSLRGGLGRRSRGRNRPSGTTIPIPDRTPERVSKSPDRWPEGDRNDAESQQVHGLLAPIWTVSQRG